MPTHNVYLILTVIGDDRPGLVGELSALISAHQGNWLESSMAQLVGHFAGIVKVGIESSAIEALNQALAALPGLKVTSEISTGMPSSVGQRMSLSLVGHDRIGIVREITQTLAQFGVNVEKFTTFISTAAMSAEALFNAQASLQLPAGLEPATLTKALERISDELMVDLTLDAA